MLQLRNPSVIRSAFGESCCTKIEITLLKSLYPKTKWYSFEDVIYNPNICVVTGSRGGNQRYS